MMTTASGSNALISSKVSRPFLPGICISITLRAENGQDGAVFVLRLGMEKD